MDRVYKTGTIEAPTGHDLLGIIRDNITTFGWTIIDDQITESNYIVVYSEGGSKNNNRLPCYIRYRHSTSYLIADLLVYWDDVTKVGYGCINYSSTSYQPYCQGVRVDEFTPNSISMSGNKDFLCIDVLRFSNSYLYTNCMFRIDNPTWDYIGVTQTETAPGTSAVMQLDTDQAQQFRIGGEYRIVSPDGHIDKTHVIAKDVVNDTITLATLVYTNLIGTRIGSLPFPWVSLGQSDRDTSYTPMTLPRGLASSYTTTAIPSCHAVNPYKAVVGPSINTDWFNHGITSIWPWLMTESTGLLGYSSYIQYCNHGEYGDKMGVNQLEVGTVSSSTVSVITDSAQNWNVDVFAGMTLVVTSGAYIDTTVHVTSNTTTTLSIEPDLEAALDPTDAFAICEAVYVLRKINGHTDLAVKDI